MVGKSNYILVIVKIGLVIWKTGNKEEVLNTYKGGHTLTRIMKVLVSKLCTIETISKIILFWYEQVEV